MCWNGQPTLDTGPSPRRWPPWTHGCLLRLLPDLLAIITADGDIVGTNPAWESLLGYRREDLAGLTLFDLLHPDDVKVTAAALKSLNGDGTARSFSNRHRHRDGSWRHLSWRANAEPSGYVFASAHDVTGDLALRRELASGRPSTRHSSTTSGGSRLSVPGGQVESANPAALEMLGLSLEELQGRSRSIRAGDPCTPICPTFK